MGAGIDTRAPFRAAAALAAADSAFGLLTVREPLPPAIRRPFRPWSSNPLGAPKAALRPALLMVAAILFHVAGKRATARPLP